MGFAAPLEAETLMLQPKLDRGTAYSHEANKPEVQPWVDPQYIYPSQKFGQCPQAFLTQPSKTAGPFLLVFPMLYHRLLDVVEIHEGLPFRHVNGYNTIIPRRVLAPLLVI